MHVSVPELIGVLIIYQSALFVFFLLFNKRAKPVFIKVLIAICFVFVLHFSTMVFNNLGIPSNYFFGPFFGLLYGPAYYFFTKSLIVKKLDLSKSIQHLIPSVAYLFLLVVFNDFVVEKMTLLGSLVTAHFAGYLLLSLQLLFKFREKLKGYMSSFYNIKLSWLEVMIYIQLLILFVAITESFVKLSSYSNLLIITVYILTLILINCFYYLGLRQVGLFKGIEEELVEASKRTEYSIAPELYETYVEQLNTFIVAERPFLQFDISLADMARSLDMSSRNLSHIINKEFHKNFYEFINGFRIEEAKRLLLTGSAPIKEVMYDSGFSNKATFNAIFRKHLHTTPTQFRLRNKIKS